MANVRRKRIWKTVGIIAAVVAIVALVAGVAVVGLSAMRERNPDNLIKVDDDYMESIENNGKGLSVDVKEDGTIKLKGKPTASDQFIVKTFVLDAGTYTISGLENPDLTKILLGVMWGSDGNVSKAYAGLDSQTFTFAEATEVTVFIDVYADAEDSDIEWQNRTIRPVIVEGDEPGEFYA